VNNQVNPRNFLKLTSNPVMTFLSKNPVKGCLSRKGLTHDHYPVIQAGNIGLFFLLKLKVVDNEKGGGLGRWQTSAVCLGMR
jgi:hypothetical protein